jgi:hypothetical protein
VAGIGPLDVRIGKVKFEDAARDLVFHRMVAKGRGGEKDPKPISAFKRAWHSACVAAGCPGAIKNGITFGIR